MDGSLPSAHLGGERVLSALQRACKLCSMSILCVLLTVTLRSAGMRKDMESALEAYCDKVSARLPQ